MTDIISILDENFDVIKFKEELIQHKDVKILSLNYFSHKILEKNKLSHTLGDLYLSMEDKSLIDDKSIDITTHWYNQDLLKPFLIYHEINLGSLIELELSQYLLSVYKKTISAIRIIEKENPKIIIVSTSINPFLKSLCNTKKLKIILLENLKTDSMYFDTINVKYNIGSIPISVKFSRKNYLKMKNIFDNITKSLFSINCNKLRYEKSILLLDFNPVSYKILLKELSKLDKNILLLNQRRPAMWNLNSMQIVRNSKCTVINLNDFEKYDHNKVKTEIIDLTDKLNKMFELNGVFENIFIFESNSLWNSIKNTFAETCISRFTESLRRITLLEQMLEKFDISVILEWAETGQEEKEIITVSKKKGIPSVLLQHGMYPNSLTWNKFARFLAHFPHPLISDKQAIWGEITKNFALKHEHNEKDLMITGSPRHDEFFNFNKIIKNKGVILLATTGASGIFTEGSTTDVHIKFENFVREVCRVAKKLDKQLIIKPHPQPDSINNVLNLVKEIDDTIPIILETDLKELISSCELLITFNNSTIALESIILGKPVISLQIERWTEESQIVKMNALLSITKEQDIEEGIIKMINDVDLINQINLNSKKFLELYLSNQGHASQTLAKFLDDF